jgi:transposase-like protein
MVQACPECDGSDLGERVTKEPRYRCHDCGARFAEPVKRTSKQGRAGLATRLIELDPDAVGREGEP